MKGLKLSVKLIGAFLVVALITGVVGYIGITRVRLLDEKDKILFNNYAVPLGDISQAAIAYNRMRVDMREMFLVAESERNGFMSRIKEREKEMEEGLAGFEKSIRSEEVRKQFDELKTAISKFLPIRDNIIKLVMEQKKDEAYKIMSRDAVALADVIKDLTKKMVDAKISGAMKISQENTATANSGVMFCLIITAVGVIAAVFLGVFLTLSITRPVNRIIAGLSDGSEQVASASSQVSAASQSLAEGASEQAAGLEETSSSIEEMASMTKQNADSANQANSLMAETSTVVNEANHAMVELTDSMKEITIASEETAKIIKTIDEIAFQTNLLALNAAVEAARAGEAGAGFAVVADEVRNLAMRASDAAKNTSNLIEGSVKKIKNGSDIVTKTNEAFSKVSTGAKKVGELVGEIAAASNEQSQGVEQINKAVAEMDKVVQKNAASAEESASAAEEMNAQAEQMREFVGELVAVVGGSNSGNGNGIHSAKALPYGDGKSRIAVRHQTKEKGTIHKMPSGNGKKEKVTAKEAAALKTIKPEQVIPLEEGNFKEF